MSAHQRENPSRSNLQPRSTWARAEYAWLFLGSVLCLSLGLLASTNTKDVEVVARHGLVILGTKMQGVRTSVYEGDRLKVRVAAAEVKVTQPRALGPIRIGFLRALTASDVTVESFAGNSTATGNTGCTGVDAEWAIASLVPKQARDTIVRADLARLKLVEHGGASTSGLDANRCWAAGRPGRLICRDGSLRGRAGDTAFKEAVYDQHSWKITAHE